jgi:wyosine [tRNA(Phe)-imidazoG37] synthetase (radical SAM superfamily)
MTAFGPVPSRRLGRSLGINNIPPKTCSYSCVYCQLGRTSQMLAERRSFYPPDDILREVQAHVQAARRLGEPIDYLTFVPEGEPTLDANLARSIDLLRPLGIPIAVITNASLLWDPEVRRALDKADWVSLKVDAVSEQTWRQIDRPHGALRLSAMLDGMLEFGAAYRGELATETMLVADLNDAPDQLCEVASFLQRLCPATAYLAIPTRPPAESYARPPSEARINHAYQILSDRLDHVEYLIGYEGNAFAFTGQASEDLLSITAVHPMRADAVAEFLAKAGEGWGIVHRLLAEGKLVELAHDGHIFYMRKLSATM